MKKGLTLFALLACFTASLFYSQPSGAASQTANAERRIALVIGNSAYKVGPLPNPVNDATDVAAALRGLGFTVTLKVNLSHREMIVAIQEFGKALQAGGVGLFYYAGHATQVNGENYLIPVSANIQAEEELEYESVNAGRVIAQMRSARNRLNIVIMDSCRDNPFVKEGRSGAGRGLAVLNATGGMLIAYSTAPGAIASDGSGRNSPYTSSLLKYLPQKSLRIEDVFKRTRAEVMRRTDYKQTPWESSSLVEDYCLSGDCGGLIIGSAGREKEGSEGRTTTKSEPEIKKEAPAKSEPVKSEATPTTTTNSSNTNPPRQENVDVQAYTETVNRVGIDMVRIPAGKFLMGSPADEKDRQSDEGPQHEVTISKSFYMGKYEVTQLQWRAVSVLPKVSIELPSDPSKFKGDNLPVEQVSWEEAVEFCERLSRATGKAYRLPTEAEWEYACRAGTTGMYAGSLDAMAWYSSNAGNTTHPVGQKQANRFGLYDMHGNVWEWCRDWYGENYYFSSPDTDPTGPSTGSYRVVRGGGWFFIAANLRAAFRNRSAPSARDGLLGFRLVRTYN